MTLLYLHSAEGATTSLRNTVCCKFPECCCFATVFFCFFLQVCTRNCKYDNHQYFVSLVLVVCHFVTRSTPQLLKFVNI